MRVLRTAAVGVAACALVGVVYGMGAASAASSAGEPAGTGTSVASTAPSPGGSTSGVTGDQKQWLERFCTNRLPRIESRLDRAVTRINGSTGTRGSIAHLQQRVDGAMAAGHDAQADLLKILLDHRTKRLPLLTSAQDQLAAWRQQYCSAS